MRCKRTPKSVNNSIQEYPPVTVCVTHKSVCDGQEPRELLTNSFPDLLLDVSLCDLSGQG